MAENLQNLAVSKEKNHRGLMPTAETALYAIAGLDIEQKLEKTFVFRFK